MVDVVMLDQTCLPDQTLKVFSINNDIYLFDSQNIKFFRVNHLAFKDVKNVASTGYCHISDLVGSSLNEVFRDNFVPQIKNKPKNDWFTAIISLTDDCNFQCAYCFRTPFLKRQSMNMETATKIIEDIHCKDLIWPEDIMRVILFGGEPLLNKNVMRYIVSELRNREFKHQIRLSLSTNGSLLNNDIGQFLLDHKVELQVSVDGSEKIQNEQRPFKGGSDSYDIVMRRVQELDFPKEQIGLRLTTTKKQPHFADEVFHFYEQGFRKIGVGFSIAGNVQEYDLNSSTMETMGCETQKIYDFMLEKLRGGELVKILPMYDSLIRLHLRKSNYVCSAAQNVFAYGVNGNIYPCQRFLGDKNYNLGHIDNGLDRTRVESILQSDEFKAHNKHCTSCWLRNLCGGNCYHIKSKNSNLCALLAQLEEKAIIAYLKIKHEKLPFAELSVNTASG